MQDSFRPAAACRCKGKYRPVTVNATCQCDAIEDRIGAIHREANIGKLAAVAVKVEHILESPNAVSLFQTIGTLWDNSVGYN